MLQMDNFLQISTDWWHAVCLANPVRSKESRAGPDLQQETVHLRHMPEVSERHGPRPQDRVQVLPYTVAQRSHPTNR